MQRNLAAMERGFLEGEADVPGTNPGAVGDEDSKDLNLYYVMGWVSRCLTVLTVTVTVPANRGKSIRRCAR